MEYLQLFLSFGLTVGLLLLGYLVGSAAEKKHLANLRQRELRHRMHIASTLAVVPAGHRVLDCELVTGSVVISLDYFKRFLATLRGIVGGRVRSYETLLDRARREALLRMREAAIDGGYSMVINVRLETSRLASGRADGKGTAGVEILAFGTALRTEESARPE